MAQQIINIGAAPNDGTGTPMRTAFNYCNLNFTELYTAVGPSGNNIVVPGTATITGDLTVRTNQLAVTSTGVGIGTASPAYAADVSVATIDGLRVKNTLATGAYFNRFHISNDTGINFIGYCSSYSGGTILGLGVGSNSIFSDAAAPFGIATTVNQPLVFGINGTTAMTLDSTGLGIGVAPSALLHVQKSQNAETTLILNNTNAGTGASVRLDLQSNASNYITLQSYGQNYVGTPFGIAGAKLNVISENAATAFSSGLLIGTTSTNPLYFATANVVRMTLDSSGNVCIGTTTATPFAGNTKAVVGGGSGAIGLTLYGGVATNNGLYFADGIVGNETYRGYLEYSHTTDSFAFGTAGANRYTIDSTGIATWLVAGTTAMTLNAVGLGIGATPASGDGSGVFTAAGTGSLTASTRVGLDVRELVSGNQAGIILGAMTTENTAVIGSRTATGNIAFQTYNGGWGERMRIDYVGNVGIGVTPSVWTAFKVLQVGDGLSAASSGSTNARIFANTYYNNGQYRYIANGAATEYEQDGYHAWKTAPSGTAGASAAVTSGQSYTVSVLGSSTLAQWQAFFSALTVLPTVGQAITATATGSIVGGGTVTQILTFTTAMALDSTGLTVSTGTTNPLDLTNAAVTTERQIKITNSTVTAYLGVEPAAGGRFVGSAANNAYFGTNVAYGLEFATNNNVRMTLNTTGNLAFKDGLGIDFSDTAGTGTSELLNDYEEGTWTGTLYGGTTTPGSPVQATGKYTKIGRQVSITIYFNNVDTTGYVGSVYITGLPFAEDGSRANGTLACYNFDFSSGTSLFANVGVTTLYCTSALTNSNWRDVLHSAGAGRYLQANVVYYV